MSLNIFQLLAESIKEAFEEGYHAGYNQGGSDTSSFECGSGPKHENTRKRDLLGAWEQSDAFAVLEKRKKLYE